MPNRGYHTRRKKNKKSDGNAAIMATSMAWAGSGTRANTLTGEGTFDPRVPIDQPGEKGDDALIWADYPKAIKDRLKNVPQLVTEDCLLGNAQGILCLYENDIVAHVVKQQLRSDAMASLVRRQGTYGEGGERDERRVTINKLSKSSFLGRDPSGQRPIPDSLWEGEELSERGTLLKDVQDTVYSYLRVHLPRILDRKILDRVQTHEETYKNDPGLLDALHNHRMPWDEYKQMVTFMLPVATGMYELAKVLTLEREDAESARSWSRRLHKGRQQVSKRMGCNLSDACYVELLFGELTRREKSELLKAQITRTQQGTHEVGDPVLEHDELVNQD